MVSQTCTMLSFRYLTFKFWCRDLQTFRALAWTRVGSLINGIQLNICYFFKWILYTHFYVACILHIDTKRKYLEIIGFQRIQPITLSLLSLMAQHGPTPRAQSFLSRPEWLRHLHITVSHASWPPGFHWFPSTRQVPNPRSNDLVAINSISLVYPTEWPHIYIFLKKYCI